LDCPFAKEHSFAQNFQNCRLLDRGTSLAQQFLPIKRFAMASSALPENRTSSVS